MSDRPSTLFRAEDDRLPLAEGEVVEIPLLLPSWQAAALETVAHQRGLTAAAMVRHLLNDFIGGHTPVRPSQAS